jgi:hypothetical protein
MKVGGSGIFRLEQLAGGRARVHIESPSAMLARKPKRGPNIQPKKRKKK